MKEISLTPLQVRRIAALTKARDKASNPEFVELWDLKLKQLAKSYMETK